MSCRQFPWYDYRTHVARHLVIPKAAKWLNHPKSQKFSCKTLSYATMKALLRLAAVRDTKQAGELTLYTLLPRVLHWF